MYTFKHLKSPAEHLKSHVYCEEKRCVSIKIFEKQLNISKITPTPCYELVFEFLSSCPILIGELIAKAWIKAQNNE